MTAAAFHDERAPYSVARLAERWECSERLIYKLIERGDLQCFRPGSLIRISAAEVERFECQTTACSGSGAASQSSTSTRESASEGNSRQRIEQLQAELAEAVAEIESLKCEF